MQSQKANHPYQQNQIHKSLLTKPNKTLQTDLKYAQLDELESVVLHQLLPIQMKLRQTERKPTSKSPFFSKINKIKQSKPQIMTARRRKGWGI